MNFSMIDIKYREGYISTHTMTNNLCYDFGLYVLQNNFTPVLLHHFIRYCNTINKVLVSIMLALQFEKYLTGTLGVPKLYYLRIF